MTKDESILLYGVGVGDMATDVFGTVKEAKIRWPHRVVDTPISEALLTGMTIGLSLGGYHPCLVHSRSDFALLGMDQLVNHILPWEKLYGDKLGITFRLVCAEGARGQGNTGHRQMVPVSDK